MVVWWCCAKWVLIYMNRGALRRETRLHSHHVVTPEVARWHDGHELLGHELLLGQCRSGPNDSGPWRRRRVEGSHGGLPELLCHGVEVGSLRGVAGDSPIARVSQSFAFPLNLSTFEWLQLGFHETGTLAKL
jgi:hypothetical protein